MISDYNEKAAVLAVRYATSVKPGDNVVIIGSTIAGDLIKAMYIETLNAGGNPFTIAQISGLNAARYKYSNDDQIKHTFPWTETLYQKMDVLINIFADTNRQEMSLVDPEKIKMAQTTPKSRELKKLLNEREAKGEFKWVIVPYPCDSFAQDAKMDTDAYAEFVYEALKLGEADPAEYWKGIEKEQDRLKSILEGLDQIQVLGEDTDLTLSVKNRPWKNCCGHRNLPDGEVFTSPIETSINGKIRFTYPGIFMGKEIENICLELKDGKVIKGTAGKGQDLLDTILSIENADKIGEFAIGTNYGVTTFTKNMLFDEKMGGTMHMALGMGFPETKSENVDCVIHWDILKDMKSEDSKIIADGKVIYQAGKWLI